MDHLHCIIQRRKTFSVEKTRLLVCMDSIKVSTPQSFPGSPTSPKRQKHTSIACEGFRKLKIRCLGGEATAISSATVVARPYNHCASLSKHCVWPQGDGRRRGRTSSPGNAGGRDNISRTRRNENSSLPSTRPLIPPTPPISTQSSQALRAPAGHGISPTTVLPAANGGANGKISFGERSKSSANKIPYTTVHYYRHLGPPAIAPGHRKISLKTRHDYDGEARHLPFLLISTKVSCYHCSALLVCYLIASSMHIWTTCFS